MKGLPVGQNCLTAEAEPKLTASMCLEVTATRETAPTEFPLVLAAVPLPGPNLDEQVTQYDKSPIELTGPALVGTVKDPSGAGIAKADIRVYGRDSKTKPDPLKVRADDQGNFTAPLEPGTYTIVLMSQGFRTRFVGVEIKRDAPKQDMSVELRIESC
jgi:carboxypeptidase family protein